MAHLGTNGDGIVKPILSSWISRTYYKSHLEFSNNVYYSIEVGYSYGDKVPVPSTAPQAARDVHAFLTIWFENFSKFKGRPFHFAGESYGGRYIPVFASHIWDRNQVAASDNRTPINLQSIMLGNGWTDPGLCVLFIPTALMEIFLTTPKALWFILRYALQELYGNTIL
jgi:carboxypeptidase C (cathepsin A)